MYVFSTHLRERFCERILNFSKETTKSYLKNQNNIIYINKLINDSLFRAKKVKQNHNLFLINKNKNIIFILKEEKILITCYKLHKHYSKEKNNSLSYYNDDGKSKIKQKMFAYNNYSYLKHL